MNPIVIAHFDIETATNQGDEPGQIPWDDHNRIEFACGVIQWTLYLRDEAQATTARKELQTNVYFSPLAMIDDLLQPWAHVICGYNAHHFDLPVLVHQAIPEEAGPYVDDRDIGLILGLARKIEQSTGRLEFPLLRLEPVRESTALAHPLGWIGRLQASIVERALRTCRYDRKIERRISNWVKLTSGYSNVLPPGMGAFRWSRVELLRHLRAKLFDPMAWMVPLINHPHPTSLDALREGLEIDPWKLDGEVFGSHAEIPKMWNAGRIWEVIDCCKADVEVLAVLLQQGMTGRNPAIFSKHLKEKNADNSPTLAFRWEQKEEGAKWKYRIPTAEWWPLLTETAERVRECQRLSS